MRASVRFRLHDGHRVDLGHGDMIGRLGAARLCLDDPSVSEAHAMVSQRGTDLFLLGLRGRFVVDGSPISKLALEVGQKIRLSRDTVLTVEALALPERVLALAGDGLGRQVLAGVTSLLVENGALRLVPRFEPGGAAWVFDVDGAWRVQVGDGSAVALHPGDTLDVAGYALRAIAVDLTDAGGDETCDDGAIYQPLRVVARYESVHVYRPREPVVVLTGLSARIISELVATRVPTPWEVVAREVWRDESSEPGDLRGRFDAAMLRLRRKLRAEGIRDDLVRTDGHGSLELVRYQGDRFEDES